MYGSTDIFRIKDVVHQFDEWQWKSKQWLADTAKLHYGFPAGRIVILGGWYGLCAYKLRQAFPDPNMSIVSIDSDPVCEDFGWKLFHDQNIEFVTQDARHELDISDCSMLVSTSVEHFDREELLNIIRHKQPSCWTILQTNNMNDHPSHINCSPDVESFADYVRPVLSTKRISFSGTLTCPGYKRMMVLGK